MSIEKDYDWFLTAVEKSIDKYEWKCGEDGDICIFNKADKTESSIGQICMEINGWIPEFGIQGMAISRCLGPYSNHTEFSGKLRQKIREITGIG